MPKPLFLPMWPGDRRGGEAGLEAVSSPAAAAAQSGVHLPSTRERGSSLSGFYRFVERAEAETKKGLSKNEHLKAKHD